MRLFVAMTLFTADSTVKGPPDYVIENVMPTCNQVIPWAPTRQWVVSVPIP